MFSHTDLADLADRFGDQFFIADPRRLTSNLARLHDAFTVRGLRTRICYSIKTNYLPAFLTSVLRAGHAAEAVSPFEYELACAVGFQPKDVVLNGPVKSAELIATACAAGARVHLDSMSEITTLERLIQSGRLDPREARIGLRCNLSLPDTPTSRFGFEVASGELENASRRIAAIKGLRLPGLHVHAAAQPKTLVAFRQRVRGIVDAARLVFVMEPPEYLDLGGGFQSPAAPAPAPSFNDYAEVAAEELARAFDPARTELILEPGVSVVLDAMHYVCRVCDVRMVGERRLAVTTGSIHNVRPTGYERHSQIFVVAPEAGERAAGPIALGGYTCMEHDLLATEWSVAPKVGDFLAISNVGAYTIVFKPPFIQLAPPILIATDSGWTIARRAESLNDFLSCYSW